MFIQNLALYLCTYLKEHGSLVEKQTDHEPLLKSLHYLLLISEVEETEIFKICLEYWNSLAADLYSESFIYSIGPDLYAEGMAIGFGCVVCVCVLSKFF